MIEKMIERKISRRNALQSLGLMGAGAALSACIQTPVMAQVTDADVLNFALNLEYLEAEFYLAAVGRAPTYGTGAGTATTGGGAVTGGAAVPFANDTIRQYAEEIALDEENHVKFLRSALGAAAVARPAIDIGPAFAAAGSAASGGAITGFSPYASDLTFLIGGFIFEDVGVTAYKGASPLIANKTFLEAAAGILAVEAYHSGEIRTLLYAQRNEPVAAGLNVAQVVQAISNLRDSVDGPSKDSNGNMVEDNDQGIVGGAGNPDFAGAAGRANIVPTDSNAIAFSRSTTQVLKIVSLNSPNNRGGFFPNGLNGTIK